MIGVREKQIIFTRGTNAKSNRKWMRVLVRIVARLHLPAAGSKCRNDAHPGAQTEELFGASAETLEACNLCRHHTPAFPVQQLSVMAQIGTQIPPYQDCRWFSHASLLFSFPWCYAAFDWIFVKWRSGLRILSWHIVPYSISLWFSMCWVIAHSRLGTGNPLREKCPLCRIVFVQHSNYEQYTRAELTSGQLWASKAADG